jgi:glyoxylase-like metal-dependent hydrolase (beta-lactamase superfamily II)
VKFHTSLEFRKRGFELFMEPGSIPTDAYVPQRMGGYQNLVDGQRFDLGGTTLEAIALPGHTQGMTCILIKELRMLLLGDGCNARTFLFSTESSSVQEYKDSLQTLRQQENKFDTVLFSHGPCQGEKTILFECIELCDEIMAGKTDNVSFSFMGGNGILAKASKPDFTRVDGKKANIVFNPDRIFSNNQ